MTIKEAKRYSVLDKAIVRKTKDILSIICIDYSDPKRTGRISHVSFQLSDGKWYGYKELESKSKLYEICC